MATKKDRTTQMAVAHALGLSQSAVSRVLADPSGAKVAPDKKKKILDHLARLARRGVVPLRGRNLALVLPALNRGNRSENYQYGLREQLIQTLEPACASRGRDLVVHFYHPEDPEALRGLSAWGAIVAAQAPDALVGAWADRFPVVAVNRPGEPDGLYPRWDRVTTDNASGMNALVAHLADLGHRRLAFIGHSLDPRGSAPQAHFIERLDAFCAALRARGLPVEKKCLVDYKPGDWTATPVVLDAIVRSLSRGAARPTALCFANDHLAVQFLKYARDVGLRIPHKFSVCGFDDIGLATKAHPPLTTLRQDFEGFARTALSVIEERSRSGVRSSRWQIRLAPSLVVRESTGPAR
ncbi:MAG: LacI family DNA-binding transcriptional regulator [Spirochaetes bacterium]|nr:LacI family DNA-binding transcriptional regulator [Spirochaetota bacterium]